MRLSEEGELGCLPIGQHPSYLLTNCKRGIQMNPKRKQVEELILKTVKTMEPKGTNYERYKKIFSEMSDAKFESYIKEIKDGRRKLTFLAPNMEVVLQQEDLMKAAVDLDVEFYSRLTFTDEVTGMKYTSPHKAIVLMLPIRRTRQYLHHGISVPDSDTHIEAISGQVTKPDQSSKFSFPEMQLLYGRGMTNTIVEFMKIRGGDINAYANFKQQLEETGHCSQQSLDSDTMARTVKITSLVLKCMGLGNNFVPEAEGTE